jgi:RNA-binding protein
MSDEDEDIEVGRTLTGAQRNYLKAQAHPLKPVVQVGQSGVTEALVAAVNQALLDHELIKVRLYRPDNKKQMAEELTAKTGAHLAGLIGHTVILYRQHPEKPKIRLPQDASE